MNFTTAFNQCFGNGLSSFGFKKLKGCNIFGRLVNNEIFQYVTFKKCNSLTAGHKAFYIQSGIRSVYSTPITEVSLKYCSISLFNYKEIDRTLYTRPAGWDVFEYNSSNLRSTLDKALKETISVAIKYMLQVNDLNSYIEYLKFVRPDQLKFANELFMDSVILIKAENHDTFDDLYKKTIESYLPIFNYNTNDPTFVENAAEIKSAIYTDIVDARDKVYKDVALYEKVMNELQTRKNINIQQLQVYGFEV